MSIFRWIDVTALEKLIWKILLFSCVGVNSVYLHEFVCLRNDFSYSMQLTFFQRPMNFFYLLKISNWTFELPWFGVAMTKFFTAVFFSQFFSSFNLEWSIILTISNGFSFSISLKSCMGMNNAIAAYCFSLLPLSWSWSKQTCLAADGTMK